MHWVGFIYSVFQQSPASPSSPAVVEGMRRQQRSDLNAGSPPEASRDVRFDYLLPYLGLFSVKPVMFLFTQHILIK